MPAERCPTCGRELSDIKHFPRVEVQLIELLQLPEKILHWSSEWPQGRGREVDITGDVKEVVAKQPMQQYLESLQRKVGSIVATSELLPPFEQWKYPFWVFIVPDSEYFLQIYNKQGEENTAVIGLFGHGPNLGSVGGPTLELCTELAKIRFQGKLLP